MDKESYTLKELCQANHVTERTVRYYIKEGLLPPPIGNGPSSHYGYEHWLRLKLIRRLKAEYLPLAEIKSRLAEKSLAELDKIARQSGLLQAESSEPSRAIENFLQPVQWGGTTLLRQQLNPAPSVSNVNMQLLPTEGQSGSRLGFQPPTFFPNEEPNEGTEDTAPETNPADLPKNQTWEHIVLAPGLEIQIESQLAQKHRPAIKELLDTARRLLRD